MESLAGFSDRLAATERLPTDGTFDPPVVFLHGLACERSQFGPQFAGLDPRLRLLAIDLPGHGGSPELPPAGRYPRSELAIIADLVAHKLAERYKESAMVVGHSAGASLPSILQCDIPALYAKYL